MDILPPDDPKMYPQDAYDQYVLHPDYPAYADVMDMDMRERSGSHLCREVG